MICFPIHTEQEEEHSQIHECFGGIDEERHDLKEIIKFKLYADLEIMYPQSQEVWLLVPVSIMYSIISQCSVSISVSMCAKIYYLSSAIPQLLWTLYADTTLTSLTICTELLCEGTYT